MDPQSSYDFILLVVLLILSVVFSSSETALMSLSKTRLRTMIDEEIKGSDKIQKIMEDPKKMLTTILIGNNVVNISASSLTTSIVLKITNGKSGMVAVATFVLTFLILVFGEITPKTVASQNAEKISLLVAPFILVCTIIFSPIAVILNSISGVFIKMFGADNDENQITITEAELKTIVDVSHEEGVLENDEREMINNVFEFGDSTAKEIMTPRTEIIAVQNTATYEELIKVFEEEKISRVPVYNETVDDIIGTLYFKDIVFLKNIINFNINDYIREVFFTYESKPISLLLTDMRTKRVSMSVVLDEYGGTSGLITNQDIIEEIFGDIHDEDDDVTENTVTAISEKEYEIDGIIRLDDFDEITGLQLDTEDFEFETVAGFVISLFGRIPEVGEEIESLEHNVKFVVEEIEKNRLDKIRVIVLD